MSYYNREYGDQKSRGPRAKTPKQLAKQQALVDKVRSQNNALQLSQYISEQTRGGQQIIDRLLELLHDDDGHVAIAAAKVLLDRHAGKAVEFRATLDLTAAILPNQQIKSLSLERRRRIEALLFDDLPDERKP